jgi:hypothetical protein
MVGGMQPRGNPIWWKPDTHTITNCVAAAGTYTVQRTIPNRQKTRPWRPHVTLWAKPVDAQLSHTHITHPIVRQGIRNRYRGEGAPHPHTPFAAATFLRQPLSPQTIQLVNKLITLSCAVHAPPRLKSPGMTWFLWCIFVCSKTTELGFIVWANVSSKFRYRGPCWRQTFPWRTALSISLLCFYCALIPDD